ncbi:MarR family winged helix-turn-helix transcriptional regulator [Oricola sp.]|uniref:MarR family winged helix-turn-helix transcriptional regulator n=1 Tax=Oricola sp. TaxID=1979950 RepID=UPI00320BC475|nr:winged helix-turn-helix transcriptional regulator [Oricola sp.]
MIGVLNIVWLNPGISQNDLAGSVALKKSAVTKVVQLLEANKLLARQRTQNDRRYKALKLTPAGEELVRNIRLETDRLHAEWFEGVKQDDRDIFFDVLIRILTNLGRKYGGALDAEES